MKLAGLRIVVTRAEHQAQTLVERLAEEGAVPILLPCVCIALPADPGPLQNAVSNIASYDWVVFTSQNAVDAVAALQPATMPNIATVGSATSRAAAAAGWKVNLKPEPYTAEALAQAFAKVAGQRILIPSSSITRDVVAPALRDRGATVDVIEAYRNVPPHHLAIAASKVFRIPYPDWVLFASPSAAQNLAAVVDLGRCKIASIGPATSQAVSALGLTVMVEANPHTTEGLLAAIDPDKNNEA